MVQQPLSSFDLELISHPLPKQMPDLSDWMASNSDSQVEAAILKMFSWYTGVYELPMGEN